MNQLLFLVWIIVFVLEMFGFVVAGMKLWLRRQHRGTAILAVVCFSQCLRIICRYIADSIIPQTPNAGVWFNLSGMLISTTTIWCFVAYLYGHWPQPDPVLPTPPPTPLSSSEQISREN